MSSPSMLGIEDLHVVFQHGDGDLSAVDGITLDVPAGQFLVITGPSGQGKSTLLRAIAGLITPTRGRVLVGGQEVQGPSRNRGLVFQQDSTFPWFRVRDNIAYGLNARNVPREQRDATVRRYLRAVDLEEFANSWPKQLSGGMRKRVQVATAFANDPEILLMDEPFGSLDFVTRTKLHATLLDLWEETGKTIVFVTHDVDETLVLADRVVVVGHGRVVDDLPVEFSRPRDDNLRVNPAAVQLRHHVLKRLGLGTTAQADRPRA